MTQKKLLIAGGGYADIPMILAAKALGFYVYTSGNRPDDMGHEYADEFQGADFSDNLAMLDLASSLGIDAICASCNDFSALSAAYVAEKLGLPGHDSYEITEILHHKDKFRDFSKVNGINVPFAMGFDSGAEAHNALSEFSYPIIIKPVDLTGGKGVSVAYSNEEASKALEYAFSASRAKRVVIEDFINGTRHGFSAIIRSWKVVFYFSDNEFYFINQYLVSAACTPGGVSVDVLNALIAVSEKYAELLSLVDGLFHVQYILRDNVPYIIEICRRPPGDLYTKFVQISTGFDYPACIVKSSAGISIDDVGPQSPLGFYSRHCIMATGNGVVKDVVIDCDINNNIVEYFSWWKPGYCVENFMVAKLGIVFLRFDSYEEMLEKTSRGQELIKALVE